MNLIDARDRFDHPTCHTDMDVQDLAPATLAMHGADRSSDPLNASETDPRIRTELAGSLHFILSQYLKPSTLRRLIAPHEAMLGRVILGRAMQGEIDDDLLARILAQAVVEHIRQSGFVVQRRSSADEGTGAINAEN